MIIGITGTNGAGKGTVVDYLVEKGFIHYSVREAIVEEIRKRGLDVNRTTTNLVATDLREKNGPGYFTEYYIDKAKNAGITNAVIESIRNPHEAEDLKKHGGVLLVVDADRRKRYERIVKRGSYTDNVSFEEFCVQEDREMTSEDPNNPAKMDVNRVISMADYTLTNDDTPENLYSQVDALPIFS